MRLIGLIWCLMLAIPALSATNAPLSVYGWPIPQMNAPTPEASLADDPIFGRLACPSLTRLNLKLKESETLLLNEIKVLPDKEKNIWRLTLKPNLKWWSGDSVTNEDVGKFVEKYLPEAVKSKRWDLPAFKIEPLQDKRSLNIVWQQKPTFGPYIFNGGAVWREDPKNAKSFECMGPYKISNDANGLTFQATSKTTPTEYSQIEIPRADKKNTGKTGRWLNFRFAQDVDAKSPSCARLIDLPILSLIIWNTNGKYTSDPEFRQALTEMTPRGDLLRAGATSMGDLISGPIPRAHPGYNRRILVREFDLAAVNKQLDKLGFKRNTHTSLRSDKDGKILTLTLRAPEASSNLVAKIVSDNMTVLGIDVKIEYTDDPKTKADGSITGLILPWPSFDFMDDFHSESKLRLAGLEIKDKELDTALEGYALSLTEKKPNFTLLQKVHERLFKLEPFTILMQHRACLEAGQGYGRPLAKVIVRDPDWFFQLID